MILERPRPGRPAAARGAIAHDLRHSSLASKPQTVQPARDQSQFSHDADHPIAPIERSVLLGAFISRLDFRLSSKSRRDIISTSFIPKNEIAVLYIEIPLMESHVPLHRSLRCGNA